LQSLGGDPSSTAEGGRRPNATVRACQAPWAQLAPTVTLQRRVRKRPPTSVPARGSARRSDATTGAGSRQGRPSCALWSPDRARRAHRDPAAEEGQIRPAQGHCRRLPTATPPSKPLAPPRRPSLPAPSSHPGSTAAGRETPASLSKRAGKVMATAGGTTQALPGGLRRRRRWGEGRLGAGARVVGVARPSPAGSDETGRNVFLQYDLLVCRLHSTATKEPNSSRTTTPAPISNFF
jgi:hypothetical protein